MIFFISLILTAVCVFFADETNRKRLDSALTAAAIVLGIFTVASFLIVACDNIFAISEYGELKAAQANVQAYSDSIEKTKLAVVTEPYISNPNAGLGINVENMKQSTNVSQFIANANTYIVKMNEKLYTWQFKNNTIYGTLFLFIKMPKELRHLDGFQLPKPNVPDGVYGKL